MSSDSIGVQISGIAELSAAMKTIGAIGERQAFGGALSKSVKPIAELANDLAPVGKDAKPESKRIRGSVIVRRRLNRSQMAKRGGKLHPVEVFVGSSRPHAHLVEFGHATVRGGKVVGHVPAHPFMRPAADALTRPATRTFFRLIGGEIERVAKRFRRQAERGKLSRGARLAFRIPL